MADADVLIESDGELMDEFDEDMINAANFGLSTEALHLSNPDGEDNQEDDAPDFFPQPQPNQPPPKKPLSVQFAEPLFQDKVKVTAAVAERGRKAIQDKLDVESMVAREKIASRIHK